MQLVDDLRRMTAVSESQYEVAGTAFWSDEDLQAAIERHISARLLQAEIDLIPTRDVGGLLFVNGRAPVRGSLDTETAMITAFSGAAIVGDSTIHNDGRVEFTESQLSSIPVISGLCYDLNAAAADVLTDWASALKLGYDISSGDSKLPRSQRHEMLLTQAESFRARAVASSVQMGRSDVRGRRPGDRGTAAAIRAFDRLGNPG